MSQTTQFISIPLAEGVTSARISTTVWGVGGAKIEDGNIKFAAGPDLIGARYVPRNILVQNIRRAKPKGYQNAGKISSNGRRMNVLVEIPED